LSAHQRVAEDHARQRSIERDHESYFVTSREFEKAGSLYVLSEWQHGKKVRE
jgi:hypothetical protein